MQYIVPLLIQGTVNINILKLKSVVIQSNDNCLRHVCCVEQVTYRLHISAERVTPCLRRISGAMYVGDPHILGFSKKLTSTLRPKS